MLVCLELACDPFGTGHGFKSNGFHRFHMLHYSTTAQQVSAVVFSDAFGACHGKSI